MIMISKPLVHRNGGFTLIEILISVVIGLLGIVVMFQVLSMWDSLKRTTAAGSDAQIAGTVAMSSLERDLRPAGMGFGKGVDNTPVPSMGCTVSAKGPTASFLLAPVRIVFGAAGAPDQIITLYGNSTLFVSTQKFKSSTSSSKEVDGSYGGFKVGDVVIAGGATAVVGCELLEVSDVTTVVGTLKHAGLRFNSAPTATTAASGFLYNLGALPQRNVWSIQSEKLYRQDSLYTATAVEVADNVIDLKAQYGIDTNDDGRIADDGTATLCTATNEWCDADPASWRQVIAVRFALLSRSQQFEKIEVTDGGAGTAPAPSWAGGNFTMFAVAGAAGDVANWKRYRYRVYEKVIPLRNMVWGGDFK
jgi:type IV pilus assembly protein PilW